MPKFCEKTAQNSGMRSFDRKCHCIMRLCQRVVNMLMRPVTW